MLSMAAHPIQLASWAPVIALSLPLRTKSCSSASPDPPTALAFGRIELTIGVPSATLGSHCSQTYWALGVATSAGRSFWTHGPPGTRSALVKLTVMTVLHPEHFL